MLHLLLVVGLALLVVGLCVTGYLLATFYTFYRNDVKQYKENHRDTGVGRESL